MKARNVVLFVCLFAFLFSQETKELSKMDKFISNVGQIIKLAQYNLPELVAYNEKVENLVSRVTIADQEKYFFIIKKEGDYDTKSASIAEDDLEDIINALNNLIKSSESETSESNYLENKFITEDGFQIGYAKKGSLFWFITLEEYGNSTILFRNYTELVNSFSSAKSKITELKK